MGRKINKPQELEKLSNNQNRTPQNNNNILSYTFSEKELLDAKISSGVSPFDFLEINSEYIKANKRILTLPEILKREIMIFKKKFDENSASYREQLAHKLWARSEEHVGIDHKGIFYKKNTPVLVTIHGKGLITPEKIKEFPENNDSHISITHTRNEFEKLLDGNLGITLLKYNDFLNKKESLKYNFGIVTPYEEVIKKIGYGGTFTLPKLLENPLAITRAGGKELLRNFFPLANSNDQMGVYHNLPHQIKKIHPNKPQGTLLRLINLKSTIFFSYGYLKDYNNFIYANKLYK